MAKAPAFQFYASDFISSTQDMDAETVGAYIRLLCFQWDNNSIPNDLKKIARIAGVPDDRFAHVWADLSAKFTPADDNRLVNPRLDNIKKEREDFIERSREYGKAGAKKRYGNIPPKDSEGTILPDRVGYGVPYSEPNGVAHENPTRVGIALQSSSSIFLEEEKKEGADAQIFGEVDDLDLPVSVNPDRPNWAPSWEEVKAYFQFLNYPHMARRFFDTNESRGWMDGKNAIQHFQGLANNWIQNSKNKPRKPTKAPAIPDSLKKPPDRKAYYTDDEYEYAVKRRQDELKKLGITLPI